MKTKGVMHLKLGMYILKSLIIMCAKFELQSLIAPLIICSDVKGNKLPDLQKC